MIRNYHNPPAFTLLRILLTKRHLQTPKVVVVVVVVVVLVVVLVLAVRSRFDIGYLVLLPKHCVLITLLYYSLRMNRDCICT